VHTKKKENQVRSYENQQEKAHLGNRRHFSQLLEMKFDAFGPKRE